jgi:hypothetical protein
MSKSTLALVAIATVFLGALIGAGIVKNSEPTTSSVAVDGPAVAGGDGDTPFIRYIADETVEIQYDQFGTSLPYLSGANFVKGQRPWQSESISIEIESDGGVEYKALMDQGDSLSFDWFVDGGQVYYDLHGHDPSFGDEFFTRYEEGEGVSGSGSIIAGYDGQHGWYWLNLEGAPITITLEVAGFYEKIVEIGLNVE